MNLKLGNKNSRRFLNLTTTGLFLTLAILVGSANPVVAAEPPDPDFILDLPAGWACGDFELRIAIWGGPQVDKKFFDKDDNLVRTLLAGKGSKLEFTNLSTGAKFSTEPNGAVQQTTINPDGSSTLTLLGHNIVILFPTDVPAGPSTTLYVGRVFITIDPSGAWTSLKGSGKTTDVCAVLSK